MKPLLGPGVLPIPAGPGSIGGDIGGSPATGPVVTGIQGFPICTTDPIAGQVLVFDGTQWCPQSTGTTVGTGTFTVGSISTITNDTYYNAWPSIARMSNGSLILVYTKAFTHHLDNSGNAVMKTSTDDGVTWSAESSVYYDVVTPLWASSAGVSVISTGRIFVTLWRDDFATPGTGEAGIVYSDDLGVTWTPWIDLTNAFTQEAYGAGPVVELPSGDLIVTIEGSDTGDPIADRSSHALFSSDGGDTWGTETTIAAFGARPYYETVLVPQSNGDLRAYHRTSGGTGTHYYNDSTDDGATWAAVTSIFTGYAQPHTALLTSGTQITVTRQNSDAAAIAYATTDGTTWGSAIVLDATMFEMEYGCPIELLDGRVLVVYGSQPTSSTSNSDIKMIYLTEITVSSSGLVIEDEGVPLSTAAGSIDFVGRNVTASGATAAKTVTVADALFSYDGGRDRIDAHGTLGATETIDIGNGNVHTGTLDQACTISTSGWFAGEGCTIRVVLLQDGTGNWLPTFSGVTWKGDAPVATAAGTYIQVMLWSDDGGTIIWGSVIGGSTASVIYAPVMAQDPSDSKWYVVVDGSGNAVMAA